MRSGMNGYALSFHKLSPVNMHSPQQTPQQKLQLWPQQQLLNMSQQHHVKHLHQHLLNSQHLAHNLCPNSSRTRKMRFPYRTLVASVRVIKKDAIIIATAIYFDCHANFIPIVYISSHIHGHTERLNSYIFSHADHTPKTTQDSDDDAGGTKHDAGKDRVCASLDFLQYVSYISSKMKQTAWMIWYTVKTYKTSLFHHVEHRLLFKQFLHIKHLIKKIKIH